MRLPRVIQALPLLMVIQLCHESALAKPSTNTNEIVARMLETLENKNLADDYGTHRMSRHESANYPEDLRELTDDYADDVSDHNRRNFHPLLRSWGNVNNHRNEKQNRLFSQEGNDMGLLRRA
jgi:hypothetical protein